MHKQGRPLNETIDELVCSILALLSKGLLLLRLSLLLGLDLDFLGCATFLEDCGKQELHEDLFNKTLLFYDLGGQGYIEVVNDLAGQLYQADVDAL